jgi:DNA-binding GntR family transcriptional regulator
MSKLIRTSMREQIYDIIKDRIMTQEYEFGDPINISTLSRELSASNTPIREALSMLSAEGLVVANVNSKFRVIEFTEESMEELNETLYVLISGTYLSCCRLKKAEGLAPLLDTAYKNQLALKESEDLGQYIRGALAFDRCFIEVAANARLLSIYDNLADIFYLSARYTYSHQENAKMNNLSQHKAILEAVRSGNQDAVIDLLARHYSKHI